MTGVEVVGVAAAGAVGALVRAGLTADDPVRRTAAVNVVGAALLGLATALLDGAALTVVGTGLLGATTTFSTWAVQAVEHPAPARVLAVPLVLGVAAAALGRVLGGVVGGGLG